MEAKSATAKASNAAARKRGWGACSKCVVFVLVPLLAVIYPALLAVGKSVVSMPKLKVVDRFLLEELAVKAGGGNRGVPDAISGVYFLDGNFVGGKPSFQLIDLSQCIWHAPELLLQCSTKLTPRALICLDGLNGGAGTADGSLMLLLSLAETGYNFHFTDASFKKAIMTQILVGVETPRNAYYMDVLADGKAEVGSLYTRHSCFPDFFGPKFLSEFVVGMHIKRPPMPEPASPDSHPACEMYSMRRIAHKGKLDTAVAARFAEVWPVGGAGGDAKWGNFSGRLSVADLA